MASADFSRFVVTACPYGLALETSPVMDVFFPPYTRLIYFESSEQLWDFVLFCRLIHSLKPSYQVSVRQVRCLPTASFRFHLTMDTFAFGCSLPTVRATWGLAPVRIRSCWANKQKSLQVIDLQGFVLKGARWDSNPRHSEPQSDALTNWTTGTMIACITESGCKGTWFVWFSQTNHVLFSFLRHSFLFYLGCAGATGAFSAGAAGACWPAGACCLDWLAPKPGRFCGLVVGFSIPSITDPFSTARGAV